MRKDTLDTDTQHKKKRDAKVKKEVEEPTSTLHVKSDHKFVPVPSYLKSTHSTKNFIPKKWVHTYMGHSKGV